ncbi:MAG: 30S ribosomal protein S4e [Nanoarchaeota archaeon]|nr:30S ribosomal protein S4e [Nanoarchaeota archaeon]
MHLKRIAAPRNWSINRKERKFIARPMPGPHGLNNAITLSILIKEFLKQAKTKKEVNYILNNKKLLVNKIARNDYRFPVGLMDIIEIPELKESYIILYNKRGKFILNPIKDSNVKLCKIINKKIVNGGKIQINLNDGRNILLDKNDYNTGDTLVFDLTTKKVKSHIKMEKDVIVYLSAGTYVGNFGKLQKVEKGNGLEEPKITFSLNNHVYTTLKKYAFVVGKEKSLIGIENE